MALTLTYRGWRPYTEVRWNGGQYGFTRDQCRDDIPEDFILRKIVPGIEQGMTMWEVGGLDDAAPSKSEAMLAVVEPVVEAPEPTPEPVAEESADESLEDMTRAELMRTAKEEGHEVKTTMKKADLIELLSGE